MTRAFIFDMDGTLIDSMDGWHHFGKIVAKYHGLADPEYFYQQTHRRSIRQVMDFLCRQYNICLTQEETWDWIMEAMDQYYTTVLPKTGALETVRQLAKAGYPVCVATATRENSARRVLERLGFGPYLKFLLSCHDIGRGKQFPDVYLLCADQMGTAPEQTLVVEDSYRCGLTASRAGFKVAGVYDPQEKDAVRFKQLADYWLDDLSGLYNRILSEN